MIDTVYLLGRGQFEIESFKDFFSFLFFFGFDFGVPTIGKLSLN
jgi:hypothetical protein